MDWVRSSISWGQTIDTSDQAVFTLKDSGLHDEEGKKINISDLITASQRQSCSFIIGGIVTHHSFSTDERNEVLSTHFLFDSYPHQLYEESNRLIWSRKCKLTAEKGMELERDLLLTLSGVNPERSLETHKRFYPENHWENRIWSYEIDTVSH